MTSRTIARIGLLAAVAVTVPCTTGAQEVGVALYYPDFQAIRALFDPSGQLNLPQGPGHQEIITSWQAITPQGRDLLLRERSLAVVVLDNRGIWLYRTASIPRLQALQGAVAGPQPGDYENLSTLLDYRWFQDLRQFYGSLLFAQGGPEIGQQVGPLLAEVDQSADLAGPQKTWFRGLVGVELQDLDNTSRADLLATPEHADAFAGALAAADARRNEWQARIGGYLSGDQAAHPLILADMPDEAGNSPWRRSPPEPVGRSEHRRPQRPDLASAGGDALRGASGQGRGDATEPHGSDEPPTERVLEGPGGAHVPDDPGDRSGLRTL